MDDAPAPTAAREGSRRIRLGGVSYLNALPLLEGLDRDPHVHILREPPSRLLALLDAGAVDAALLPVGAMLGRDDLCEIGGACIGARGPVDSVLLLLRRAPHRVEELVLDPSSRSSQLLARILLHERYGARPACLELEPLEAWHEGRGDAVLIIGDAALQIVGSGVPALDLSAEWYALTGLPFVFAVWAGKRERFESLDQDVFEAQHDLLDLLWEACERGCASLAAIAHRSAAEAGLDPAVLECYLRRRIVYQMDPAARAGLARFRELAAGLPA